MSTTRTRLLSDLNARRDWDPRDHPDLRPSKVTTGKGGIKDARPKPRAPRQPRAKTPVYVEPTPPSVLKGLSTDGIGKLAIERTRRDQDRSTVALVKSMRKAMPTLHAKQREILASKAKRKAINCGRRFGKTTFGAWVAEDAMLRGRRVLIASTTQEQTDAAWEKLNKWLEPWIDKGIIEKNETKRILEFPLTGGRIRCKTASDADTLRGDWGDLLILDECSRLEENAWKQVGAPMMLDTNGDTLFLSTPNRRNWYYRIFLRGKHDETGRWASFHATSHDNPFLSKEALAEITQDMTEQDYQQEILAEFLEGEGSVFLNVDGCSIAPYPADPLRHKGHVKVAGLDWARKNDYTVLDIGCQTCMQELYMLRIHNRRFSAQRNEIVNACNTWEVSYILAELNSIGLPNIETLQEEEGMPVEGFDMQNEAKNQLVQVMRLTLEREKLQLQPIEVANDEMEAYEEVVSKKTGLATYSGPDDMNDDTVVARMLMLRAAMTYITTNLPSAVSYSDLSVEDMVAGDGMGDYYEDATVGVMPYGTPLALGSLGSAGSYASALRPPPGRPW